MRESAQRAILRQKAVYKYLSAISVIADDFVDKFRGQCQIDDVLHHLMEFSTESKFSFYFEYFFTIKEINTQLQFQLYFFQKYADNIGLIFVVVRKGPR